MKKKFIIPILALFLSNCCSFSYMFRADEKLDIIKRIPSAKKEIIFNATKKQLITNYDIVGTNILYDNIKKGQIRTYSTSYPSKDPKIGSFSYIMEINIKDDTLMISYTDIISDYLGKKNKISMNPKWEVILNHIITLRDKLVTLIINDIITDL